jgi:hypothetical protein
MERAALPAESDRFRLLGLLVGASHVGRFAHRIFSFEGRAQGPPVIAKEQVSHASSK